MAEIKLIAGRTAIDISKLIAQRFPNDIDSKTTKTISFKDGGFMSYLPETVRGKHVFLIQSHVPPADNFYELLQMVDSAKGAGASKVTVVLPYLEGRQDHKNLPRAPITIRSNAISLEAAGVDSVITMDQHSQQIQGIFRIPLTTLHASEVFIPHIKNLNLEDFIMASPDAGGISRAKFYAAELNTDLAICYKHRIKANEIDEMRLFGDVNDKTVIFVDDMIDTGGTLAEAAKLVIENGAKNILFYATHGVLSANAYNTILNSYISMLYVTDTIKLKQKSNKIEVISAAEIFAKTIRNIYYGRSVSTDFREKIV